MHNFIPNNPENQTTIDIFVIFFFVFRMVVSLFYETVVNSTSSDDGAAGQPYLGKYINLGHKYLFTRFNISHRVRLHWGGGESGECYNVSYTNFKVIRNQPVTSCFVSQLITFLLMVNKAFFKLHCITLYKTKVKIALMKFSTNVDIIKS